MNKNQSQITRTCKRCGVIYEGDEVEACFRTFRRSNGVVRVQLQCKDCEQTQNDQRKRANRSKKKAQNTRRAHCRKYNARHGTSFTPREFGEKFHWDIKRMTHEIDYAFGNGCPRCGEDYKKMGHGLGDVTIDIKEPEVDPVYGVNTQWICSTCNKQKQRTPTRLLAARETGSRKWRKRREELEADQWAGTLFEGLEVNGQRRLF